MAEIKNSMYGASGPTAIGVPIAAPVGVAMGSNMDIFQNEAISVEQTMRGCFQECLGCEAKSEYKVFAGHVPDGQKRQAGTPQAAHLLEDSSCLVRWCCGIMRPFDMNLTRGTPPDVKNNVFGEKLMLYKKPWSFPICCIIKTEDGNFPIPCCCCLPRLRTISPSGQLLGSSRYICDLNLCVPKWYVFKGAENSKPQYVVRPDTCCMGCCIACKCSGGRGAHMIYVPFYIRDPQTYEAVPSNVTDHMGDNKAQIKKVWSGLKKECCSDADNFQVLYPAGADLETRANLLGANILIDFTFYEEQDGY